jgi:6-phosphogluconolactonase (cycloisomerase 2 family)
LTVLRTKRRSEKIQETTILAKDFIGAVGSDIHISPDGLFFIPIEERSRFLFSKLVKTGL